MFISKFQVKNFLIHKNSEFVLDQLNVFVGPNGSGKSAFFDALVNFSMVARGNIKQAFGQYPFTYAATRFHGSSKNARIGFAITFKQSSDAQDSLTYEIDYEQSGPADAFGAKFAIPQERLILKHDDKEKVLFDRSDPDESPLHCGQYIEADRGILAAARFAGLRGAHEQEFPFVDEIAQKVSRFSKFRLDSYNLAGSSKVPEVSNEAIAPRIGYYGDDLTSVLYYLDQLEHPSLAKIIEKVKEIVPEFAGFAFNFIGSDKIGLSIQFDDKRGTVPAVRISDGLLVFIGLMVLIYSPDRPPVLLIEEPENGLTPVAIKHFYQAIRELANAEDALNRRQVMVSSHSPFVICEAWNGLDREFIHRVEVLNGSAVIKKFSQVVKEHHIVIKSDGNLSLKNAEDIMCGRYLGDAV